LHISYQIDPETGAPHIHDHQVSEGEVEDVLRRSGEDRPAQEGGARMAIGVASSGQYLRVVYVADPEPDRVAVITAYELTGKALLAYSRRRRRRP